MRAVVIRVGDEYFREAVQVTVIRRARLVKLLSGGDAVLFQHHHEHLRVDHGSGVEELHDVEGKQGCGGEAMADNGESGQVGRWVSG